MKKELILLILCFFTRFIYSDCYRAIDNNTTEPPSFLSVIDELINDNPIYLEMISKHQIENISIEDVLKETTAYSEDIQLKLVKLAYENGGSLSGSSSTAIIESVRMNKYSIVEYLLSLDAGKKLIDVKHNMFARPLFYALYNGNEKITELLLINGADPSLTTSYGDTMVEMLQNWSDEGILTKEKVKELNQLLEKYSCNIKIVPLEMSDFIKYPFKDVELTNNRLKYKDFYDTYSKEFKIEGTFNKASNCIIKVSNHNTERIYFWDPEMEEFFNLSLSIKLTDKDILQRNISKGMSIEEVIDIFNDKNYIIDEDNGFTTLEYNIDGSGFCRFSFYDGILQEIYIIKDWSQILSISYIIL